MISKYHTFTIKISLSVLSMNPIIYSLYQSYSVPLTANDFAFLTGDLNEDAFLGTLYLRDDQVELGEDSFVFSKPASVENKIRVIQDMPFDELKHRLVKHAQICSAFRHFSLLRLEPFEEQIQPKLEEIPFLLPRRCMMDRYYKGKLPNKFIGDFKFFKLCLI